MKLYRVCLKVRPSKQHPAFFNFQCGYAWVWLFTDSMEDASARARKILEQLPFESMSTKSGVADDFTEETCPVMQSMEKIARQIGFASFFETLPVGTDEEFFEKHYPT